MAKPNIPCPSGCKTIDPETKKESVGLLFEVNENTGRYFCRTSGCTFAYIDEQKNEHWVGIGIKSKIVPVIHEELLINS